MNRPEKLPSTVSPHIASRMEGIEPFHVVVLINRAKELEAQGRTIANMVVGEPDAPTPPLIAAAGIRAIEGGRISYTSSLGIAELRGGIAACVIFQRGIGWRARPQNQPAISGGSSMAAICSRSSRMRSCQ